MHVFLEYVWLDGNQSEPNIRSKTKVLVDWTPSEDGSFSLDEVPEWSFDGSSTQQAEGHSSDCILKPVRIYRDPLRRKSMAFLVLCEVYTADGKPHPTNHRALVSEDLSENDTWWGFEQEYVLTISGSPLGFPATGFPAPQGPYYCANGSENVAGRDISEAHLEACLVAGLSITGTNAEVLLGQWEYQLFGMEALKAADDLWISRFILHRIAEPYGVTIDLHPKPLQGDWNGSGMHANFSNEAMRTTGGKELFDSIFTEFESLHSEMIKEYGSNNHLRLTGKHETQSIDKFSWGISDRGSSIRVPIPTVKNNWVGYLEDRRPASNANPYLIVKWIKGILDNHRG